MSSYVLGLDVSTSVTGVAIIETTTAYDPQRHVALLKPIEFKQKTLWEKVDHVRAELTTLHSEFPNVSALYIEEPLKNFSSGLSSADTIVSLIRFNGIVSLVCRDLWQLTPTYINASHARKLVGVKVQRTTIAGKSAKEQTFDHVMSSELSHVVWPTKKNGQPKDWSRDVVDAYVIARAGSIENS